MKVIKVTLVIHKVNMFSEKYPVEIKFNFVHGDNEKIADLNDDFKSYWNDTILEKRRYLFPCLI